MLYTWNTFDSFLRMIMQDDNKTGNNSSVKYR